ncbi:MAG: bifunctional DNA primase/polymerase [Phycisphaerales bacterium]|nr:bifunctional DNA primase/polymerase [Phycisphaerales bacterium]
MPQDTSNSSNACQMAGERYLAAGLCALPADARHKRPRGSWKRYQTERPTRFELGNCDGVAVVCGAASGGLETLDFDAPDAFTAWADAVPPELLARLYIERTPRGGAHAIYLVTGGAQGNQRLASRIGADGRPEVLIETRGEGGLVLVAPTPGYVATNGELAALPTLSRAERDALIKAAKALDELEPATVGGPDDDTDDDSPCFVARDFAERGDVRGLLERHGWTFVGMGDGTNELWRRPGKDGDGHSATWNGAKFYVFSTAAPPFASGTAYDALGVLATLEHNGDVQQAIRAAEREGFGTFGVDLTHLLAALDAKPPTHGGLAFADVLDDLLAAALDGRPLVKTLATGCELLDESGGLACGEYLGLVGSPGVGKTLLADALTLGVLRADADATALTVALETAPAVRVARLVAGQAVRFNPATGVERFLPLSDLLRGELDPAGRELLCETAAALGDEIGTRWRFNTDADSAGAIAALVRRTRPTLLVVDHIGLLTLNGDDPVAGLDGALAAIQSALRESEAAAILVGELSKSALRSGDTSLASVRGSARFASLAGQVLSLSRDNESGDGDPCLKLALTKCRHGRAHLEQSAELLGGLGLVRLLPGVHPMGARGD